MQEQQVVIDGKQISDQEVEGLLDSEDETEYVTVQSVIKETWIPVMEDLCKHWLGRCVSTKVLS